MNRIIAGIKRFNLYCFGFSAVFLIFVALITFFDVIGRFFRVPIPGTFELSQLALSCMVFFTLAHTQAIKGHVFLDYAIPLPRKLMTVVDVLLTLLSLGLMSVFTWKSVPFIIEAYNSHEWSDYHHIPMFLVKIVLFWGGLTFCLQLILDIIEIIKNHGRSTVGTTID